MKRTKEDMEKDNPVKYFQSPAAVRTSKPPFL